MNKLIIEGKNKLAGIVPISGFKHSLVPILAASVFVEDELVIENIPNIEDSKVLTQILTLLGGSITQTDNTLTVRAFDLNNRLISNHLMSKIHGSIYLIPSLLGKFGEINLGFSGGCQIGDQSHLGLRPTHHILNVLELFGANFEIVGDRIIGKCSRFKAAQIDIKNYWTDKRFTSGPLASGATKTALLAASTALGTTVIKNPYLKIDVLELIEFLKESGVQIEIENKAVVVEGRCNLNGSHHKVIPDLIEIITFIACAVHLKTTLHLKIASKAKVCQGLMAEFQFLDQMGVELKWENEMLTISPPAQLQSLDLEVSPDGIYSDSHPFFALMLTSGKNLSTITEKVWKDRFFYARQLNRLGAELKIKHGILKISPKRPFRNNLTLKCNDLRSAAVLLLATLDIEGITILKDVEHLNRGYENLVSKLQNIGAHIKVH